MCLVLPLQMTIEKKFIDESETSDLTAEAPASLDVGFAVRVEEALSVDPITRGVMEENGFNENSKFYRVTNPEYIVGKTDDGRYLIRGNPESIVTVDDLYENKENTRASSLEPGINVMSKPSDKYNSHGELMVEVRLGDMLTQGGKIYKDRGSGSHRAWYLTVPEDVLIPIEIHTEMDQGLEDKIELGILYNEQITVMSGLVDLYQPNSEFAEETQAYFQEKLNDTWRMVGNVFFEIAERRLTLKPVKLESADMPREKKILNVMVLGILLKNSEIENIEFPDGSSMAVSEFLEAQNS